MDVKLKVFDRLCRAETFTINGKEAEQSDFGYLYDADPEDADGCGCGDRTFMREGSMPRVLRKYRITQAEYEDVCGLLEKALSFGRCSCCA